MMYHWFNKTGIFGLTPLLLTLVFIIACASSAPADPIVVKKEVVKEVIKEVVVEKEVLIEVPKEVVVEKEVIKEVIKEIMVFSTPAPAMAMEQPEWVEIGAGKNYNGDFPLMGKSNPGFWDIHYGGSTNATLVPTSPRFNQLLEYNPVKPSEIIGDLAKSWEVNAAGDEYIFRLHDVKWNDGKPVTADDIVFSLDRITEPGATRSRTGHLKRWYSPGTATAVDAKTVKVPLKYPASTFIPNLASDYMKMYPKHVVENLSQDDMNCCPEKYFGSGPFIFRDWKKDSEYRFEKNPDYFKAPRPFFDGLHVFIVKSKSRTKAALVAGQAFGLYQPFSGAPDAWEPLEKDTDGRIRTVVAPNGTTAKIWLNFTVPPFDNPNVRRAIFLAVDRPALAKTVFGKWALPGTFFTPGLVEDLDKMADVPGYRANKQEDFDEAKKLLAEAGYPNGLNLTLNSQNKGSILSVTEAVTAQLRKDVGIDFTISGKDLASYYKELEDGTHPASLLGHPALVGDPGDIINQVYEKDIGGNPHNWSHPGLDKLIAAQDLELDNDKRMEMFRQMVEILREGTSHAVPLVWNHKGGALDYRIRNYYVPVASSQIHKWDHIWFDLDREMPTEPGYQP